MFVTNWISTTKIQKISEITNFFRHYFLSRTEVKLHFIPSEQSLLLGVGAQQITHIRSKINSKLFGKSGAKTLDANLWRI